MKALFWLTIALFLLALFFAVSKLKNQSEEKLNPPVAEGEEPSPTLIPQPVSLSVFPDTLLQGEFARITIAGLVLISTIKSLTLDGKPLAVFVDEDTVGALVGIDLHRKPGSYLITLTLLDDRKIEKKIEVKQRTMATTEFDIPEQLGGNTPQAEHALTSTLANDKAIIDPVTSFVGKEKLWNGPFQLPLGGTPIITDVYGYSRETGSVTLSHNGTDFRAAVGTPVYAMNSGTVALAQTLRNYGHTVIIDHGLGLMTMYMHLSESNVRPGDSVEKGDSIARSGNTGYSLGPHLHLSVRIDGFSIDPMKFLELMGSK